MPTTETFSATTTWTCPAGVTSVQVECLGGGGGGGNGSGGASGGDGGPGGFYAKRNSLPVTPGNNYTITIGNSPTPGFSTTQFISDSGSCVASALSATGDTTFNGGTGGTGRGTNPWTGGGGGGAAGSAGNGGAGQSGLSGGGGGIAGTGSIAGTSPGDGGATDTPGVTPGGGGGGGTDTGLGQNGGTGFMALTYTASTTLVNTTDTVGFAILDVSDIVVGTFLDVIDTLSFAIIDVSDLVAVVNVSDTVGFGIVEGPETINTKLAGYRSMAGIWLGGFGASNRASGGERIATIINYYQPVASITS